MSVFRFFVPIQVRFGDLDPLWHVNNSRFHTYLEHARIAYLIELGLFDGRSFLEVGSILADVHIAFLAPITLQQQIRVGTRVVRLGNKSLDFEYQIEDENTGSILAKAETVMVAYDSHAGKSCPIPIYWREKISAFEGISSGPTPTTKKS
jgi:acyl-CoA thioester hydrolase